MMSLIDVGSLGQDAEQHVLEGEDLLDQADGGVVDALPQRLVGLAELLFHRRHALVGRLVLAVSLSMSASLRSSISVSSASKSADDAGERILAERLHAGVEALDEGLDLRAPVGDPFLGRFELGIDAVGDLVDREVDLAQILAPRLAERVLDQLFPVVAPGREPRADAALLLLERVAIRGLGGGEPSPKMRLASVSISLRMFSTSVRVFVLIRRWSR